MNFIGKKDNIFIEEIKEAVVLKKNDRVALPQDLKKISVSLGWKCKGGADVDASVIPLNGDGEVTDILYYSELRRNGMIHTGDNRLGGKGRDDETIHIDLD